MRTHISAPELRNLLANALLFIDKGKDAFELLDGVLLHELKGGLAALSTDRYRMAEILAVPNQVDPEFRLFVTKAQATSILELVKPLLKDKVSQIRIEVSEDRESFTVGNLWADDDADLQFTAHPDQERNAKNLFAARNLFPTDPLRHPSEHGMAHVPIVHLASFARVKDHRQTPDKNDTLLLIPSPAQRKPTVILRGDWFRGLLMPCLTGQWREAAHHNQRRFL